MHNKATQTEKNYSEKDQKSFKCNAYQNICSSLKYYQKNIYEILNVKITYHIDANFAHTLDMNKKNSRDTFTVNQLVNNFTKKNQ